MRASQAVHVFVEIHHLEPIELIRHLLDLLFLARLDGLDSRIIPFDIGPRSFLVLSPHFDSPARYFSIVDILDLVVTNCTRHLVEMIISCVREMLVFVLVIILFLIGMQWTLKSSS
jgi:hypothetical protein